MTAATASADVRIGGARASAEQSTSEQISRMRRCERPGCYEQFVSRSAKRRARGVFAAWRVAWLCVACWIGRHVTANGVGIDVVSV